MESPLNTTLGARMSAYLTTSDDYRKQRKRLNKRLLKLRHELGLITRDTKNYQAKEKTSAVTAQDYDSDERFALVLLYTAERDVLYALEIKSLMEISNDKLASYKNLMVSKIKKSLSLSKKLLEITANEKSDLKRIELYIYAALIQGQLSIAKKQWSSALNAFSVARCALDFLYAKSDTQNDEESQFSKTLVTELIDTLVDPSLSLAVSQDESTTSDLKSLSRKHCHDDKLPYLQGVIKTLETLDASFVAELASSIELKRVVQWRDHESNLYNDEIAYKIMKLTNDDQTNWKQYNDANEYDKLITGWTEVLELHRADVDKNNDDDDLEKVQDRAILLTYINYNLLFTRLKRDLLIIDNLNAANSIQNNKDTYRLLGGIVSITQELKDLPGVYNDEDLYQSLENLEKYYQAEKTLVLADSFKYNGSFAEALKLYGYVHEDLLTVEEKYYKIDSFPYGVTSNEAFGKFYQELEKKVLQAHISAQFSHDLSGKEKLYVVENLDKYPSGGLDQIANINTVPRLQALLSKPVLFDVAYNYINYEGKAKAAPPSDVSASGAEEEKKRGGFFGIFGRN